MAASRRWGNEAGDDPATQGGTTKTVVWMIATRSGSSLDLACGYRARRWPSLAIGEHNDHVLSENLGMTDQEITE